MKKRCSKCGCEKDICDFSRKRARGDSYQCWCKKCVQKYQKEYYKENKDKLNEDMREYHQTPNGKTALAHGQKKYHQTSKGKTVKGCAQKKYYQTPKGKMAIKKARHRRRDHMECTEVTLTAEQ